MTLTLTELGQAVRARRVARKLSQQQLADALDIPQAQVSTFEQFGRGVKFDRVVHICNYLGLTLHWTEETPQAAEDLPSVVKVAETAPAPGTPPIAWIGQAPVEGEPEP